MMQCPKCNNDIISAENIKIIDEWNIPFRCSECKGIDFPLRAVNDKIFIYPKQTSERTLNGIIIPEYIRSQLNSEYGVVMSAPKGYLVKKGRYHKATKYIQVELITGDIVIYDKTTLGEIEKKDKDEVKHKIKIVGHQDVLALIRQ